MADNKNFAIEINGDGGVKISEEVVCIIAGLAAAEVDGVESLAGGLTSETISKAGISKLAKAVRVVDGEESKIVVRMSINIKFGYEIPTVCSTIQDKVKTAIETMTGLEVTAVDIRIATVSVAQA